MRQVPAIYLPRKSDPFFHASMSCSKGDGSANLSLVSRRITDRYKVNTFDFVISFGKFPCPECWRRQGYDALNDVVAMRG